MRSTKQAGDRRQCSAKLCEDASEGRGWPPLASALDVLRPGGSRDADTALALSPCLTHFWAGDGTDLPYGNFWQLSSLLFWVWEREHILLCSPHGSSYRACHQAALVSSECLQFRKALSGGSRVSLYTPSTSAFMSNQGDVCLVISLTLLPFNSLRTWPQRRVLFNWAPLSLPSTSPFGNFTVKRSESCPWRFSKLWNRCRLEQQPQNVCSAPCFPRQLLPPPPLVPSLCLASLFYPFPESLGALRRPGIGSKTCADPPSQGCAGGRQRQNWQDSHPVVWSTGLCSPKQKGTGWGGS